MLYVTPDVGPGQEEELDSAVAVTVLEHQREGLWERGEPGGIHEWSG